MSNPVTMTEATAILLAGGDGTRLRALTRLLSGDDRPKQFCAVVGGDTLLEQTRRRVARLIPPERTVFSLCRAHERFWAPALAGVPSRALVVQPASRGTAPAVLSAVLRAEALAPAAPVAIFPTDHHVADDDGFMARVEGALETVRARGDLVVLLGISPDRPEPQYGWIEPAELILGPWPWPVFRVGRFREKPSPERARSLQRAGALWNSFVLVGRPAALRALIARALPAMAGAVAAAGGADSTPADEDRLRPAYAGIPASDLSRDVLQRHPEALAVLPVSGVGWTDLGDPARVATTRARLAWQPVPA